MMPLMRSISQNLALWPGYMVVQNSLFFQIRIGKRTWVVLACADVSLDDHSMFIHNFMYLSFKCLPFSEKGNSLGHYFYYSFSFYATFSKIATGYFSKHHVTSN